MSYQAQVWLFTMIISRFEKSHCSPKSLVPLPLKPNFIKTLATGGISKSMTTKKTWLMFGIDFCDVQMKSRYHREFSTNFFKQSYLETSTEDIREGHSIVVYCFTDSLFSRVYSLVDLWCLNTMKFTVASFNFGSFSLTEIISHAQ